MQCWDDRGNAVCACGRVGSGHVRRDVAVEYLRVLGWRHSAGVTIGGERYEAILCPECAQGEKVRRVSRSTIVDEELPLDWEACRPQGHGEGVSSR